MNTKKAEHTAGPWEADNRDSGEYTSPRRAIYYQANYQKTSNSKYHIADVLYPTSASDTVGANERDANARLIAAAPELLAALKRLKDQMTNLLLICEPPARFAESFNSGQKQARTAIAKAEGE